MTPKFIRCDNCKIEVPSKRCEFADYHVTIDDVEYVFCCEKCAQQFREHKNTPQR